LPARRRQLADDILFGKLPKSTGWHMLPKTGIAPRLQIFQLNRVATFSL